MKGRVMKANTQYLLVDLYQVRQTTSWEVYSCILFQHAARGLRIFSNKADILMEVMHFYNTEGLTSYWRIRGNE